MKIIITLVLSLSLTLLMSQHLTESIANDPSTPVGIYGSTAGSHADGANEVGVLGISTATGMGWNYGVQGTATGSGGPQFGVYGFSTGNGVYGTASSNAGHVAVFGQIFGTTTSPLRVAIQGDIAAGTTGGANAVILAGKFNGNVDVSGTVAQGSDKKLKRNIETYSGSLKDINRLRVAKYKYKHEQYKSFPKEDQIGFIAQEIRKVFPHLVGESAISQGLDESNEEYLSNFSDKKYLTVNYIGLIPILTEGIKELSNTVEDQKSMISQQQKQINVLMRELEAIKISIEK